VNRYRWGLWAPTSGLASAAFFVLAFAFSTEVGGESRDLSEFYSDSGNRAQVQTAFFCFAAAFLLLVWFVWTLRNRLMAAEGAPGNLSSLAFTAGMVSVPLWSWPVPLLRHLHSITRPANSTSRPLSSWAGPDTELS
jgi:magnesium-transporting ATPase (P-type)